MLKMLNKLNKKVCAVLDTDAEKKERLERFEQWASSIARDPWLTYHACLDRDVFQTSLKNHKVHLLSKRHRAFASMDCDFCTHNHKHGLRLLHP